jgi:hypothetical protein
MLKGGEFGYDAFGDLDLGRFPAKKNLPYSGLSRNEDYDAIKKNLKNPAYKLAEDSYMQLHKLYMQMSKTRMSEANKIKLLEEVKSHNEDIHFQDGKEPQWFNDYVAEIDKKIEEAEQAVQDKNKKDAASLEYQAAIEEKKLAYMIMEYLSGVAVGSGERARTWRSDRTRSGEPGSLERTYERKSDHSVVERALAAEQEKVARQVQRTADDIRAGPPAVEGPENNKSLGILNGLTFGLVGQPSNSQLAAQAEALEKSAAKAQALKERDAREVLLGARAAVQSPINVSSRSPQEVIDLRSPEDLQVAQQQRIQIAESPVLRALSPEQKRELVDEAVRVRRSRRIQNLSPSGGFKGGAKKKRSSRSKKAKSRSRYSKKAKKHSM